MSVRNAHSHHFLTRVQAYMNTDKGDAPPVRRLPGVEQALKKVGLATSTRTARK